MNSKNDFSAEENDLAETIISFAFVCRGTLKDFETIRSFILKFSKAKLVFQTKAIAPLWIRRTPPPNKEDSQK